MRHKLRLDVGFLVKMKVLDWYNMAKIMTLTLINNFQMCQTPRSIHTVNGLFSGQ